MVHMRVLNRTRLVLLAAVAAYIWTASIEQEFAARWSTGATGDPQPADIGANDTATFVLLEGQRVPARLAHPERAVPAVPDHGARVAMDARR